MGRRTWWGLVAIGMLLGGARASASSCEGFTLGDQVAVTDEGVAKLCKTTAWKRTGTITSLTVRSCPDCVKIRRGLVLSESISCGFLQPIAPPPEPPPPAPAPVPVPPPPPAPAPAPIPPPPTADWTIPLTLTSPVTVPYPIVQGVLLPSGRLTDAASVRCLEVLCQGSPIARWPDGSIKSVRVAFLAQPGRLTYTVTAGSAQTSTLPMTTTWPGTLQSTEMDGTPHSPIWREHQVVEVGPVRQVDRWVGTLTPQLDVRAWVHTYTGIPGQWVTLTLIGSQPDQTGSQNVSELESMPTIQVRSYDWRLPFTGGVPHTLAQTGRSLYHTASDGNKWFNHEEFSQPLIPNFIQTPTGGMALRHAWQQYPKTWRVTDQDVTLSLHPVEASAKGMPIGIYPASDTTQPPLAASDRPGGLYVLRSGGAKTYEVLLWDGPGLAPYAALLDEPPHAWPTQDYIASTGVLGPLQAANERSASMDAAVVRTYERSLPKGVLEPHNWRDWGDRRRLSTGETMNSYGGTHRGAEPWFRHYLRTRDERWWRFAERETRHVMDLDISHVNRPSQPYGHVFGPGELLDANHDNGDHENRNLHDGHAHLTGLPSYWLLTGDERAGEVLGELAAWWRNFATAYYSHEPLAYTDAQPYRQDAERHVAWPMECLNLAYDAEGNPADHAAASLIMTRLLAWWKWQTPLLEDNHIIQLSDWTVGTGAWLTNPRGENCPMGWNGGNPWMAGALMTAAIHWLTVDTDHPEWHADVRMMLLQEANHLLRYYDRNGHNFKYAPCGATLEGVTHLLYPMGWAWREMQTNGAPAWFVRMDELRDFLTTPRTWGDDDYGFYGYELVYPADWWVLGEALP